VKSEKFKKAVGSKEYGVRRREWKIKMQNVEK
jgi:hypothetical protein